MTRATVRFGRPADCREVLELVAGYLDGVLPAGRRRRFEDHLAGCAECPVQLERLRVTIEVLRCFGTGDIPRDVLTRLGGAFLRSEVSPLSGPGSPPVSGSGASPLLGPGSPPVPEGGQ